jgi:hypothetical protein
MTLIQIIKNISFVMLNTFERNTGRLIQVYLLFRRKSIGKIS